MENVGIWEKTTKESKQTPNKNTAIQTNKKLIHIDITKGLGFGQGHRLPWHTSCMERKHCNVHFKTFINAS